MLASVLRLGWDILEQAAGMTNYKAIVFDPDTCLSTALEQSRVLNITLCPAASAEQFAESVSNESADLILLDLELPEGVNGLELISRLRKSKPNIPAIVLSTRSPREEDWITAASEPFVELMQTPFTPAKLQYHLSRLFQSNIKAPLKVAHHEVFAQAVDELRNESGRLDANLVGKIFDLSATDLAKIIGVSRQAITQTPDSKTVQPVLRDFERLARSLLTVTGSMKGLKMWLHSANKQFDGHTPSEIIRLGKIGLLADWVDDARLGSPD